MARSDRPQRAGTLGAPLGSWVRFVEYGRYRKPRDRVLPHCWPIPRNDRFQAIFQIKPSLGAARGLEGNAQSRLWAAADAVAVDQTNVGVNKIIHVVRWLPPDPNDKSPAIEPEPD